MHRDIFGLVVNLEAVKGISYVKNQITNFIAVHSTAKLFVNIVPARHLSDFVKDTLQMWSSLIKDKQCRDLMSTQGSKEACL